MTPTKNKSKFDPNALPEGKPVESSAKRAESGGNPHPVAPEERKGPLGPAVTQVADRAQQLAAVSEANAKLHEESEARV